MHTKKYSKDNTCLLNTNKVIKHLSPQKKKRTKKGTKLYFFFLIYLYVKPNSVYNWFKPMAIKVSTIQLDMMVKVSDPLVGEAAAGTTVALETGTVGAMEDVA